MRNPIPSSTRLACRAQQIERSESGAHLAGRALSSDAKRLNGTRRPTRSRCAAITFAAASASAPLSLLRHNQRSQAIGAAKGGRDRCASSSHLWSSSARFSCIQMADSGPASASQSQTQTQTRTQTETPPRFSQLLIRVRVHL